MEPYLFLGNMLWNHIVAVTGLDCRGYSALRTIQWQGQCSCKMAKPQKGKRKAPGQVITDPRFAKVHTDARFQIFPNKQRKVVIDDRFKGGGGCTSLFQRGLDKG